MRAKVSNGPDHGGFDYRAGPTPTAIFTPDIKAQRVLWFFQIEGSARDILAQFKQTRSASVPAAGRPCLLTAALRERPTAGGVRPHGQRSQGGDCRAEPCATRCRRSLGGKFKRHGKSHGHFGHLWNCRKETLRWPKPNQRRTTISDLTSTDWARSVAKQIAAEMKDYPRQDFGPRRRLCDVSRRTVENLAAGLGEFSRQARRGETTMSETLQ